MSRLGRWNKERNQRVRQAREQLAIVQEAIVAIRKVVTAAANDPAQLLAATTRLDALLRRQDRLQRVIDRVRDPKQERQESAKPPAIANDELLAELARRGLLPCASPENGPEEG